MSELVKALRDAYEETDTVYFHLRTIIKDAADTIGRLTAENAEKQKLLDEWCSGEDHFQEVTEQLECAKSWNADLLQKTQQLEQQNAKLTARLAAAVEDLYRIASCDACKHYGAGENACGKPYVESYKCFEWRGEESE